MVKHVIYRTTNLVNKKVYIGVHSTRDINDSYLGSGKLLKKALSKYGRLNFEKEILFVFDDLDKAYEKEAELVNESFINSKLTYNLIKGGTGVGGFSKTSELTREKLKKFRGELHHAFGKTYSDDHKSRISKSLKGKNLGKRRSNETKLKMRHAKLGKLLSDETKSKIAKANLGQVRSNETREKIRIAQCGKKLSETHKRNIAIASSLRTHSQQTKEKLKQYSGERHVNKNKKWYNNGERNALLNENNSVGWIIGRLPLKRENSSNVR